MPTPAEIRLQSTLDANAYISSRVWALEDQTIAEIRREVESTYARLVQALILIFSTYATGNTWNATDSAYRQRTDSLTITIGLVMGELYRVVISISFDAAIRAQQAGYYGSAWVLQNAVRPVATSVSMGAITIPAGTVGDLATAAAVRAVSVVVEPLPIEAIRAAILSPYRGSTFMDRYINGRDEFVTIIKRSVVESQVGGESMAEAARRLRDALGLNRQSPGGYLNRVEMITRTEIIRSSNAGTEAIYQRNKDVLSGVEFKATNDERTCPRCGSLDGKQYKWGEPKPEIPIHPNCRCDYLPVLINTALETLIVGPRITYADWAKANGITMLEDGGVPRQERGKRAPKSPTGGGVKESLVYPVRVERMIARQGALEP